MYYPRVYLLLVSIPKLAPQLAWLSLYFNSKILPKDYFEKYNWKRLQIKAQDDFQCTTLACIYSFSVLFSCFKALSNRMSRVQWRQVAILSKIDNFKFSADSAPLRSNLVPLNYNLLWVTAKRSLIWFHRLARLCLRFLSR